MAANCRENMKDAVRLDGVRGFSARGSCRTCDESVDQSSAFSHTPSCSLGEVHNLCAGLSEGQGGVLPALCRKVDIHVEDACRNAFSVYIDVDFVILQTVHISVRHIREESFDDQVLILVKYEFLHMQIHTVAGNPGTIGSDACFVNIALHSNLAGQFLAIDFGGDYGGASLVGLDNAARVALLLLSLIVDAAKAGVTASSTSIRTTTRERILFIVFMFMSPFIFRSLSVRKALFFQLTPS